jgi:hypothetical protein
LRLLLLCFLSLVFCYFFYYYFRNYCSYYYFFLIINYYDCIIIILLTFAGIRRQAASLAQQTRFIVRSLMSVSERVSMSECGYALMYGREIYSGTTQKFEIAHQYEFQVSKLAVISAVYVSFAVYRFLFSV